MNIGISCNGNHCGFLKNFVRTRAANTVSRNKWVYFGRIRTSGKSIKDHAVFFYLLIFRFSEGLVSLWVEEISQYHNRAPLRTRRSALA
jgi:hypothetical protein